MAPTLHYLPNGQTLTVSPVFAGFSFKANDLNIHHQSIFPPGWTVILETGEDEDPTTVSVDPKDTLYGFGKRHSTRYKKPTLQSDNLFISSISNPNSADFRPATSPTRQIAMMLWATLSWYFHQPAPDPHVTGKDVNPDTPIEGRPKGQWRINIKREGILKGKKLMPKLETMGLISTLDSCVGANDDRNSEGYSHMFVSQSSFWQLDARIFLFTLSPTQHSPFPGASPMPSRPGSPNRGDGTQIPSPRLGSNSEAAGENNGYSPKRPHSPGPFASSSHLPTYYPPPPPQYMFTTSIRHPMRPKPPSQGFTFYTRYIPSLGQYLSFRTASLSTKPPTYRGPTSGGAGGTPNFLPPHSGVSIATLPNSLNSLNLHPCDIDLLHDWMNQPRVSHFWGTAGPVAVQETFLTRALNDRHSFPVIGCWDGKPFGYFEIYWVKEDALGRFVTGRESSHYDRGIHVLIGEQEFRGSHRVKVWLSALVHYCWLADQRTQRVFCEPRVDNHKFINYLQDVGFAKEKEITFPHKQAALMKIVREGWEAPEK